MSGPTYTYTKEVPLAATPFNQTQSPILDNFRAINELLGVNHVSFNTVNDFGKHKFIVMPAQSDDPVTGSNEMNMFVKETPGGDNPTEIFVSLPSDSSTVQISNVDLPNPNDDTTGIPAGTNGSGWCKFSDSGIIYKWGTSSVTTTTIGSGSPSGTGTITYPTGGSIPVFTKRAAYVKVTMTASPTGLDFASISTVGTNANANYDPLRFNVTTTKTGTFTVNWFAIGI